MRTARFALFLMPFLLFCLGWLLLTLAGRRPTKFGFKVSFSLLLLLYFLAVVGTGIFWVAAQELPVFDWHYLPGYILLLLTLAHVAMHWRSVSALLRHGAPRAWMQGHGTQWKGWVKVTGYGTLALCAGLVVFQAGRQSGARSIRFEAIPAAPEAEGAASSPSKAPEVPASEIPPVIPARRVTEGGASTTLAELYHGGSSYPAKGKLTGLTLSGRPEICKEVPGAAEVALPVIRPDGGGPVAKAYLAWTVGQVRKKAAPMDLEQLSLMLWHTQGVSKELQVRGATFGLRTAPSAGALYPVDVYVAVRQLRGVDAGLYVYHPQRHVLQRLQAGDLSAQLGPVCGNPEAIRSAPATVVFGCTFARTAFKYKERAYRYVAMDTGHAAYQLALVAASMGHRAPAVARFDDRAVNRLLGLDGTTEAAFLVMPLGPTADGPGPRFQSAPMDAKGQGTFIDLIHGGSALRAGKETGSTLLHPALAELGLPSEMGDLPLPKPAEGKGLYAAIRERRSVRDYTKAPMEMEELSALCLASAGVPKGPWADPFLATTAPLGLYVAVREVKGLEAGVYRYLPGTHALRRIKTGDVSGACMAACLQQEFCGTADAVFVKTVRWVDLFWPDGDRGYRYANLRAGLLGGGLYLQGTALGLGVCGVGAFEDPAVAGLLGLDLTREVPLYVTAVGK
jgi:SagB-type dehydrogenase family enzyme